MWVYSSIVELSSFRVLGFCRCPRRCLSINRPLSRWCFGPKWDRKIPGGVRTAGVALGECCNDIGATPKPRVSATDWRAPSALGRCAIFGPAWSRTSQQARAAAVHWNRAFIGIVRSLESCVHWNRAFIAMAGRCRSLQSLQSLGRLHAYRDANHA